MGRPAPASANGRARITPTLGMMRAAAPRVPSAPGSAAVLTMRLIAAALLLFAITVMTLSAHHDQDPVGIGSAAPAVDAITAGASAADVEATAATSESAALAVTTVCVLLAVSCVAIVAARRLLRRTTARVPLSLSPRASPPAPTRFLALPRSPSLTQLSISRI